MVCKIHLREFVQTKSEINQDSKVNYGTQFISGSLAITPGHEFEGTSYVYTLRFEEISLVRHHSTTSFRPPLTSPAEQSSYQSVSHQRQTNFGDTDRA